MTKTTPPAETTCKSLATFVESTIKFRMNGMAEVLADSDPDSMAHGELRIRMDEDKAILGVLRSFKGWNSKSSSDRKSLTALQRKVLALINLRQGRYNKRLREDPETAIADLTIVYGWIRGTSDGSESSSESLTGLKEAVEKLRTQTLTMIADDGMDEKRFEFVKKVEVLKLIEERE